MKQQVTEPLQEKAFQNQSAEKFLSKLNSEDLDENQRHYSVTINRPPQEVFNFWRDFTNLRYFMKDISDVRVLTPLTSHWVVQMKAGTMIQWDVEIAEERPGQMIAWRSTADSEIHTIGCVYFEAAPGQRGTTVRMSMIYDKPQGLITEFTQKFSNEDPETLILTNLRRLKAFLETGEIPTIEGQSSGRQEAVSNYKH